MGLKIWREPITSTTTAMMRKKNSENWGTKVSGVWYQVINGFLFSHEYFIQNELIFGFCHHSAIASGNVMRLVY